MRVIWALAFLIVLIWVLEAAVGSNQPIASPTSSTALRSEDGVDDSSWQRIVQPDGDVAAIIDLRAIIRDRNGNAHAEVCLIKNGACPIGYRQRWYFNCRDHSYSWIDTTVLPQFPHKMTSAKPKPVADRLVSIACASNSSPVGSAQNVPKGSLAEYEAIMLPARRNVAIAYVASICQLRNSFYLGIFSAQQQRIFDRERALHRLTPNEWKKAAADSNRAWGEALWQIGSRARGDLTGIPCQTLRTDHRFLENLDRKFLLLSADSQLNAEAATTAGLGR